MTQVTYDHDGLHVRFDRWERLMTGRSRFDAAPASLLSARVEPGWTSEILGFRRGLAVSGWRKLGVFTHPSGTKRLVSMRRGLPLLRISVARTTTGYDELLLSTDHAAALAAAIGTRVTS